MRANRDRPDAGAPATVRYAKRLVQVEVGYVSAKLAGRGKPHQGIQVGAIDIDLPAMRVHDGADLDDAGLEHAVRRRIGDHDRSELFTMRFRFGAQVS